MKRDHSRSLHSICATYRTVLGRLNLATGLLSVTCRDVVTFGTGLLQPLQRPNPAPLHILKHPNSRRFSICFPAFSEHLGPLTQPLRAGRINPLRRRYEPPKAVEYRLATYISSAEEIGNVLPAPTRRGNTPQTEKSPHCRCRQWGLGGHKLRCMQCLLFLFPHHHHWPQ
jgi:hypothetical protein